MARGAVGSAARAKATASDDWRRPKRLLAAAGDKSPIACSLHQRAPLAAPLGDPAPAAAFVLICRSENLGPRLDLCGPTDGRSSQLERDPNCQRDGCGDDLGEQIAQRPLDLKPKQRAHMVAAHLFRARQTSSATRASPSSRRRPQWTPFGRKKSRLDRRAIREDVKIVVVVVAWPRRPNEVVIIIVAVVVVGLVPRSKSELRLEGYLNFNLLRRQTNSSHLAGSQRASLGASRERSI